MLTSHFVRNGDVLTAYHDEGQGEPFVLVHGFTGSKLDFHDQLQWFTETHRVLTPDQRGHGESSNFGHVDAYSFDVLAQDLAGFLDALDVEHCHLLGHSMGGMVAIRFALRHPQRLKSLILMDTLAEPLPMFSKTIRDQLAKDVRANGCASRVKMMREMPMGDAQKRGIDFLGSDEHWRRIELKLSQMDPEAWVALSDEISSQKSRLPDLGAIDDADDDHRRRTRHPLRGTVSDVWPKQFPTPASRRFPSPPTARNTKTRRTWRRVIDAHLAAFS